MHCLHEASLYRMVNMCKLLVVSLLFSSYGTDCETHLNSDWRVLENSKSNIKLTSNKHDILQRDRILLIKL